MRQPTVEYTNATTTQCFDPATGGWASDLLDRLEVPDLLPEIVAPATRLGTVMTTSPTRRASPAPRWSLRRRTTPPPPSQASLSAARDRRLSVGTWSLVGLETSEPVLTDDYVRANVTNEAGVAGTFRVLRNVTGLWLLHECRRAWEQAGRAYEFSQLVELARSAPSHRSLVDPNAALFAEPGDMPARIASFCEATGQDSPVDDAATVRCILESLALKHAETVDVLDE